MLELVMNYLAHLLLSPEDDHSRLGNVMGDFLRGVDREALPQKVQDGIRLHHAVDRFTDEHEVVKDLRSRFSPKRRRFAGIALDVVFDHYLIKHWDKHSSQGLDSFIDESYASLRRGEHLMPERMLRVTRWMMDHDWLRSYEQLSGVGRALDGLAGRLQMKHEFHGSIAEIRSNESAIDDGFRKFFPEFIVDIFEEAHRKKH